AAIAMALSLWGRFVARRQGGGWWRFLTPVPFIALGMSTLGVAASVLQTLHVFSEVERGVPAAKVQHLAEGVTRGLSVANIALPVALLLSVASVLGLIFGTLKAPSPRRLA